MASVIVRPGNREDLDRIRGIQELSPEAAHWKPEDYLDHDLGVALRDGQVVGFLVMRAITLDESEILNVAIHPDFRRCGIGRGLFDWMRQRYSGAIYLEVRESNHAAQNFYQSLGFQEISRRPGYYASPPEGAVVMKFHSC